ncbi:hypothetical protein [Bacillus sp. Marseille-P3661]|uniref:hypothetical protein n=1 Tax=Bacillus sp. Marseille-P3661 TaxID=1936234 RepID=UPI000C83EA96|nr:hypothetical protein [Bacillus sp. Marseille-P3661]
MLKMKDVYESLEKHTIQLESVNGNYYEAKYGETDLEELRSTLNALCEKLPSDESVSRTLELIDYDTPFNKLVSMKEVELSELEENGVLDPDSYDAGSLISEKSEERYYTLFEEARTDLEELINLIHVICICE